MKLFTLTKINLMQWRLNPKYLISLLYLALITWSQLHGYNQIAIDYGTKIHPWVFAVMPVDPVHYIQIYIAILILISDAPFRSRSQQFVMLRVGKRRWILGQMVYLLILNLLFTALFWVFSWIWYLPSIDWKPTWGPILKSLAASDINSWFYGTLPMTGFDSAIRGITPLALTAWTAGMMVGVGYLLSMMVMLSNLWGRKGIGIVGAGCFIMLPLFMDFLKRTPYDLRRLLWVSPVSWLDRDLLNSGLKSLPTTGWALGLTAGLGILLSVLCFGTIHRCNLDTEET